jgi:hypothetical protein
LLLVHTWGRAGSGWRPTTHDGLARVERHPNPKREVFGPSLGLKRALESYGSGDRIDGAAEDREEAIPLSALLDKGAAVLGDDRTSERIMAGESGVHGRGLLLPEAGAGLNVGEQEGDRSGR